MRKEKIPAAVTTRRLLLCLSAVFAVLVLFTSGNTHAQDPVVVIVNAKNPVRSLSLEEIYDYYTNKTLEWPNGKRLVLYNLRVREEARKVFSEKVLGEEPEKVAMEWANKKITNTAKNPPRTVRSEILMQAKVGKDSAAIGYLFKSDVTSDKVKIVAIIR